MNDLEAIADLAADAPLPQLADMSAARARLDAAIAVELTGAPAVIGAHSGTWHGRASRRRWIAGGAGAVVIGAAAAVAVAVALPGGPPRTPPRGHRVAVRQAPSLRTATLTAKQVLDSAAAAALTGSPVIPRPDQYVYVKINDGNGIVQSWYSVDGRRGGLSDNAGFPPLWCPAACATASCTPRPAFFPDMPTTASAIGPWLAQTQGASTANPNVLGKIAGVILENDYLLPAQRAALYEFLAPRPGSPWCTASRTPRPCGRRHHLDVRRFCHARLRRRHARLSRLEHRGPARREGRGRPAEQRDRGPHWRTAEQLAHALGEGGTPGAGAPPSREPPGAAARPTGDEAASRGRRR